MKLGAAVTRYITTRRNRGEIRGDTPRNLRSTLRRFAALAGNPELSALSRRHVNRWLDTRSHLAPSTRRNEMSDVQVFCRWMVQEGWIKASPCAHWGRLPRADHQPRPISLTDARALVAAAPDARARWIVLAMLQLALRACEVARMQYGDIDWTDRVVVIRGKGDHQRVVPITDEAHAALVAYVAETGARAGPVVRSMVTPAHGVSANYISKLMSRWLTDAGVKQAARDGITGHTCRHRSLTDVARGPGGVIAARDLGGHASLATTQRYVGPWINEDLRRHIEGRRYAPG